MALENALIAKIIGGVSVIGGAGSAGVVYRAEISELVSSLLKREVVKETKISGDYLIVEHQIETESKDIPTENLYVGKAKKFKCEKDENNIDESCEIYSLTVDATKKLLNLKTTDANTKVKGKLAKGSYYKLKVDLSKFTSITYDAKYEIELKSNVKGNAKSYGKLKVLAKINNGTLITDNKLIIAKVKSNAIVNTTVDSYKCQIGESKEQTWECGIYKFDPVLTQLSSLTLATNPTKLDQSLTVDLKENNYYIIDFSDETNSSKWPNLNENYLKDTIIFVNTKDDKASSKWAEFIEAKSFVGKYKEPDNNNQVFISYTEGK